MTVQWQPNKALWTPGFTASQGHPIPGFQDAYWDYLNGGTVKIVTDPVKGNVIRCTLPAGSGTQRAEIEPGYSNTISIGQTQWIGFDLKITGAQPSSAWNLFYQFKNDGTGSPPVAMNICEFGDSQIDFSEPQRWGPNSPNDISHFAGLPTGWVRWAIGIYADRTNGWVEVWKDDGSGPVQVFRKDGWRAYTSASDSGNLSGSTIYSSRSTAYNKMGGYRGANGTTVVYDHTNHIIATTRAEVMSGTTGGATTPPTGDFTWTPTSPVTGSPTTFTATVAPAAGKTIIGCAWTSDGVAFGTSSNVATLTYQNVHAAPGAHVVCTVTQSDGTPLVIQHDVIVAANPGPTGNLAWKGLNWTKRTGPSGSPGVGTWSASNITGPDANGWLTFNMSGQVGCELDSTQQGFGYGTYTLVTSANFAAMAPNAVWGGLFTYDNTMSNATGHNEIDVCETSAWGGSTVRVDNTYFNSTNTQANSGGVSAYPAGQSVSTPAPGTGDNTYEMIWAPGKITWNWYTASGAAKTLKQTAVATSNVPVPNNESLCINLWPFGSSAGTVSVVVKDVSFVPAGTTPPDPGGGDPTDISSVDVEDVAESFDGAVADSTFNTITGNVGQSSGLQRLTVSTVSPIAEAATARNVSVVDGAIAYTSWTLPTITGGTGEVVDSFTVGLPNGGFIVTRLHLLSGSPTVINCRLAEPVAGGGLSDPGMLSIPIASLSGINGIAQGFLDDGKTVVFLWTADNGVTWLELARRQLATTYFSGVLCNLAHHLEILAGTPTVSEASIGSAVGYADPTLGAADTGGSGTTLGDPSALVLVTGSVDVDTNDTSGMTAKARLAVTSPNATGLDGTEPRTWWLSTNGTSGWVKLAHDGTDTTDTVRGLPLGATVYLSERDQASDGTLSGFAPALTVTTPPGLAPMTKLISRRIEGDGTVTLYWQTPPNEQNVEEIHIYRHFTGEDYPRIDGELDQSQAVYKGDGTQNPSNANEFYWTDTGLVDDVAVYHLLVAAR